MCIDMGIVSGKLLTPVDIVVDSREYSKQKQYIESLRVKGFKIAVMKLEVGDYYLLAPEDKKPVLVERKSITDFLNSIRDNRIWEQTRLLKKAAEEENAIPIIVLEGSLNIIKRFTKWNITSVLRIMDELLTSYDVKILPVPNKEATFQWLAAKARSLGSTNRKRIFRLRVEKKPLTLNDRILYVAESIVGPTIARRLLRHFKTLRNIANASINELMKVEGVGEKRAKEIYSIFNSIWVEDKQH